MITAGPANLTVTLLPRNKPTPIAPPMAIIVSCRGLRCLCSPSDVRAEEGAAGAACPSASLREIWIPSSLVRISFVYLPVRGGGQARLSGRQPSAELFPLIPQCGHTSPDGRGARPDRRIKS